MKKTVFAAALAAFVLVMAGAFPAEAAFVVNAKWGTNTQVIQPTIEIKTDSATQVDLNGYTISYYFYQGALPISWGALSGAPAGTSMALERLPQTYTGANGKNANYAIRLIVNTSKLVSNNQSFTFTPSLTGSQTFTQTDDWSYVNNNVPNQYTPDTKITLTINGKGGLFTFYGTHPSMDYPTQWALARSKIKHVFIIMQENHSYDNLFGRFPKGDGIASAPTPPSSFTCNGTTFNGLGYRALTETTLAQDLPHVMQDAKRSFGCDTPISPAAPDESCARGPTFDSNYLMPNDFLIATSLYNGCNQTNLNHTLGQYEGFSGGNIPTRYPPVYNYWTLAQNFMLQDRMFAPAASYSFVTHSYLYSGWSAVCPTSSTCTGDMNQLFTTYPTVPTPNCCSIPPQPMLTDTTTKKWLWNDLASMLQSAGVSWGLFKGEHYNPNCSACSTNPSSCIGLNNRNDPTATIWVPLKNFKNVGGTAFATKANQSLTTFLSNVNGPEDMVPRVNWIIPGLDVSDHPGGANNGTDDLMNGQAYVTMLIQQIAKNAALWNSSAIFVAWDDWGGYYDHVRPPMDTNSATPRMVYGIRVPGLSISAYTHTGYAIDHDTYSFDAYLKFIEDIFLLGTRISTSDHRPVQRETMTSVGLLGDLVNEFDFNRTPLSTSTIMSLPCTPLPH